MKNLAYILALTLFGFGFFVPNASAQSKLFQNDTLTVEYYKRLDNGKIAFERAWDIPEKERQKSYETLLRGKPPYDLKEGVPSKGQGGSFRLIFRDKANHTRLIAYAYPGVTMLQEVTDHETLVYKDAKSFNMFLLRETKERGIRGRIPVPNEPPSWHCPEPLVTITYNLIEEKKYKNMTLKNPEIQICDKQTLARYRNYIEDLPEADKESLAPWSTPKRGSFLFFKRKPEADFPEDVAVFAGYVQISEAIWSEYAVQDTGGLYDRLKKETDVE